MIEDELKHQLCELLRDGIRNRVILSGLFLTCPTSATQTLADLIGSAAYEIIEDNSIWNPYPKFMVDVIGNMTPDIVIRASASGENRIYIEVKKTRPIGHDRETSQVIRYFLHLLAFTSRGKPGDIRRAIILAAPSSWFKKPRNADDWQYFINTYRDLASGFSIILAELRLDSLLPNCLSPST